MGTECRSFGVVDSKQVLQLANLLRGLCFKYGSFELHEMVLKVPLMGGASSTFIKLVRKLVKPDAAKHQNPFVEKQQERWLLLHEGLPLRGPHLNDLPAAMREVAETHCFNNSTPAFWQSLGAKYDHEMVKKGNEYLCSHMGHEVKVQLLQALSVPQPGDLEHARNITGKYVLDVSLRVPNGKHAEGAQALGSFAQRLVPLVTLQRAEVPIL